MKADPKALLDQLIDLANHYPSPHNGQPIRLKVVSATELQLFFDTSRGLTSTPISYLFSFVTIGVFVRHLEHCGEALGIEVTFKPDLPRVDDMASGKLLPCGTIRLRFDASEPDAAIATLIRNRQTSRKKYSAGLSADHQARLIDLATGDGIKLSFLDRAAANQAIWLNQRAVFDDMFNPAVRTELDHWLRYSADEKDTKRDGLAYDCMELSGRALRFVVDHYRILRWPIIAPLLRQYYLRTMADASTVGYITTAFETEQQSYDIGRTVIDLWLDMTRTGAYLHPFGTIVSNNEAHADFTSLVGLTDETRSNYVVFIFRAGHSSEPVRSQRIPADQHLLMES